MNDHRKEVGMQCSLTGILVRSRMRWAGLVRMDAGRLAKRAEVKKRQGRRKRGGHSWDGRTAWGGIWEDRGRMKDGEGAAHRKLWKERTEKWLDNTVTVPDPHPCTWPSPLYLTLTPVPDPCTSPPVQRATRRKSRSFNINTRTDVEVKYTSFITYI